MEIHIIPNLAVGLLVLIQASLNYHNKLSQKRIHAGKQNKKAK